MQNTKKWDLLFIEEENSSFDANTQKFAQVFQKVDKATTAEEVLELLERNHYDMVVNDISVEVVEGILLHKKIKAQKPDLCQFAFVLPKDSDKLFAIADLGVNAFELTPEQFDLALEEIAKFNPYAEVK